MTKEMKIKEATAHIVYYVEIEGGGYGDVYTEYRTNETGSHWEVAMGQSWETVYRDEELRTEFLKFMREKG
jgi:hypothetical protein